MDLPIRACETERIAPDTYVLRQLTGEGVNPIAVYVNSMVITGDEPVIVDAGPAITRSLWLDQAFAVVEPEDVRWIYVSHDDHDHTGNLLELLDRCPRATLVTTHFMVERLLAEFVLPLDRMRWVNDGDRFDAGDRTLVAVTPPVFDSPTSRGLFDATSGVYWAVDAFAAPVLTDTLDIDELDPGFWREGFLQFNRMISPWHRWLDPARYQVQLDRIRDLGATAVASAHSPTLRGRQIASALELLKELPHLPAVELPGQPDLEAMLAGLAAEPSAA